MFILFYFILFFFFLFIYFFFYLFYFLIQFYVPFKIISAHMRYVPISRWAKTGEPREPREKPPSTPTSITWLVSHVASAGLEPTPDTAVR